MGILTVAALGMATLLALLADTGHDQLWLLLAAQRMGPTLNPYNSTVFESNPPLAIWLSALVVHAANLFHLSFTVALKSAVTCLALASAATCATLIRRLHPDLSRNQLWLLGIAFILIFGAVPVRDFGQRDHLLALFVLPYLCAAALDLAGHRQPFAIRLLTTLAAALGIAFKPHQVFVAITVETTLLLTQVVPHLRRGSIATKVGIGQRPTALRLLEPTVFILSALTYLTAIRVVAPTYFTGILPLLRDTYWAFGSPSLYQLQRSAIGLHILLALTVAIYVYRTRRRPASPSSPLILILLAAGIGATLGYTAQGTGWYYQQLPAISFFSLALVLELTNNPGAPCLASETWVPKWLPIPIAILTLLAFALATYFSDFEIIPNRPFPASIQQAQPIPDPAFFAGLPPGAPVATLTTSVDATVPAAFRFHLTLAQRYPHLWMLPAILRNESGPTPTHRLPPARLSELDSLQHAFMVEDLNRWHPLLILVERCQDPAVHCQVLEDRHDNLLAFFLRDPAFASIFSKYHLVRSSGPYDAYALN